MRLCRQIDSPDSGRSCLFVLMVLLFFCRVHSAQATGNSERKDTPAHAELVQKMHLLMLGAQREEGKKLAQSLLRENPNDRDALRALANCYEKEKDATLAIPILEKLVRLEPRETVFWGRLGRCYRMVGDNRKEADVWKRAEAVDSSARFQARLWAGRSISCNGCGLKEEALRNARLAIHTDPSESRGYSALASFYFDARQYERAAEQYQLALQHNPDKEDVFLILSSMAHCYKALGESKRALAIYDQMISCQPENPDCYVDRGSTFQICGLYDKAMADYNHALRLSPECSGAHTWRGSLLRRLGRNEEALADLNKGIANQSDTMSRRARLVRGLLLLEMKKYAASIEDFNSIVSQPNESSAAGYTLRAKARAALGQKELAEMDKRTAELFANQIFPVGGF